MFGSFRSPSLALDHACTASGTFTRAGGAKMVTWRDQLTETPSHFTDIDNKRSVVIENLSGFRQSKFETTESKEHKLKKTEHYRRERCYATSHCTGDANPLEFRRQNPIRQCRYPGHRRTSVARCRGLWNSNLARAA